MIVPQKALPWKLYLIVLLLILTTYHLFKSQRAALTQVYRTAVTGKKAIFIQDALATTITGPYNASSVQALCRRTAWHDGLMFRCGASLPEAIEARDVVLMCLRYAIEAGATGFILPEITIDSETPEVVLPTALPLSRYFDLDFLTEALADACPRLHIYSHINELWDVYSLGTPHELPPMDLYPVYPFGFPPASKASWSSTFHEWLNTTAPPYHATRPIAVTLLHPIRYPVARDGRELVESFGQLLRFRSEIRGMASTVLFALSERYALGLSPSKGIQPGKFFAVDLLLYGTDAGPVQPHAYHTTVHHNGLRLAYVSSTSTPEDQKAQGSLAALLASLNVTCTTKFALLEQPGLEADLVALGQLPADLQQLVDMEVLLRGSQFVGVGDSDIAANVAVRRNLALPERRTTTAAAAAAANGTQTASGTAAATGTSRTPGWLGPQSYVDELSIVFGAPRTGVFTFEGMMWP